MFRCLSCGRYFNKPHRIKETHYELSPPVPEFFAVCPLCNEGDIVRHGYIQLRLWKNKSA